MWGDCGMGGAARAAIVVSQPWRARPASQRKRRLKWRARAFPGASLESARHPSVALARPCKRQRRDAINSDQGMPGLAGRSRAWPLGISRAAKGWACPPLDEQVFREEDCRRAAGPVPQGRSASDLEGGRARRAEHRHSPEGAAITIRIGVRIRIRRTEKQGARGHSKSHWKPCGRNKKVDGK